MHNQNSKMAWSPLTEQHVELPLVDGILSRRSVHPKRLVEPGPSNLAIAQIVAAAATATDHGGLRPWRFIAITGDSRAALGEIFVEIKLRREGEVTHTELERERDRARSVPTLIAIVSRLVTGHPMVPVAEQYASIGAAVQNMLLCAHGLGFGAKMVSGRKISDHQLSFAFDLDPTEALFGFLCLGTAVLGASLKPRPPVEEILSYWQPGVINEKSVHGLTVSRESEATN